MSRTNEQRNPEDAMRDATQSYLAGHPRAALAYVEAALVGDPQNYEALVMAGELYAFCAPDLDLEPAEGSAQGLAYLDQAIAARPGDADAYAAKALVLLYGERFGEALQCAHAGLERLGSGPLGDDAGRGVWVNIGESLYRAAALALLHLGRGEAGRHVLAEGLARFPESEYLTQAVDDFLVDPS